MHRLAQVSLLLMSCCAYGAQPQAAPAPEAKLTGAALSPKDPGFIEEDPALAKLVGKPAPALTLKSIDRKPMNLSDLYGKRPVYLKLWATYCIPCRVQMPGLRKIVASYGDQMTIIAVNAGVGDDIGKVKQFVQDFDLHMPVAVDDGRLGAWIGMRATPVHLVIGRDGRVIFAGHQDGPQLDAALKQALASKAAPAGVATTTLAELVTLKAGDVVPPIELQSSDGKSITLPHGPDSRPRAIYFSATWCESYMKSTQPDEAAKCKEGREQVDKLAAGQTIEWFGVMSHMWTAPKALANYESKMKPPVPLGLDSTGAAFRTFGVKRFPAIALIDTQGRLVKLVEGDPAKFATAISPLQASK
jgi:thiol-disulfide isomerase/thioredoxin